jgi:hypothetical protein
MVEIPPVKRKNMSRAKALIRKISGSDFQEVGDGVLQ